MKKAAIILAAVICIATYISCRQEQKTPEKKIAAILLSEIDDFSAAKNKLQEAVMTGSDGKTLQQLFRETRLKYKKFEWAAEYFAPAATRFVNGAPVPEVELSGAVFDPQGLQVIESLLYPAYDTSKRTALLQRLKQLQGGCDNYTTYFKNIDILDWQVFDAAKLQVFRMLTLGITGFDTPLLQNSLEESAVSLAGMKNVLACYMHHDDPEHIEQEISAAADYLSAHPDFNSFDRAAFITGYGNPLSVSISNMEKRLNIHVMRYNRLLNQDAKTLFDKDAFNINAYTPDMSSISSDKKTALGEKLFSDPMLSGDGSRSCRSCHQPGKAFTDGLVKNTVLHSSTPLKRNTPTLLNAALQPAQFYDTRAIMLEDQARAVIENKDEMHGSVAKATQALWADTSYRQMFSDAFPIKDRKEIAEPEILNAIGSYIRSLTALNSRFDAYMTGNKNAMTADELHGFNLFMGKAKCGTCHYMPLFNGTFPPRYMRIETEVIGVPAAAGSTAIDSDMGRYGIIQRDFFKHAFKTSTVRNAAHTAPYMHNGVYKTLDEVVDFYNKGGGKGLGMDIDNQTLPFDKLNLTKKECDDIVAFIKTLDSK